jgi:hypothetical protein
VGVLERVLDEFNRGEWQLQSEGSKTSRELPAIVDQIITMNWLDYGDGEPPARGFVCTSPNPWNYPAKDRSGRLEQIEEPHLGKLLAKNEHGRFLRLQRCRRTTQLRHDPERHDLRLATHHQARRRQ